MENIEFYLKSVKDNLISFYYFYFRKKFLKKIIIMDIVPNEIWWQVMLFLPLQDLQNFIFSSKTFYSIQKNDNFWKERFNLRFKHGYPNCYVFKERKNVKYKDGYLLFSGFLNMSPEKLIGFVGKKDFWKKMGAQHARFLIEYVKIHTSILNYLPKGYKINNKYILLNAMKNKPSVFYIYSNSKLRNDKDVVLAAVKNNGFYLQYASDELKIDKDVVLAAVKENGYSLHYASDELKNDREVVLQAIKKYPRSLGVASIKIENDFDIFLTAFKIDNSILEDVRGNWIFDNEKKMLQLIGINKDALDYASVRLKRDQKFMKEALIIFTTSTNILTKRGKKIILNSLESGHPLKLSSKEDYYYLFEKNF